MDKAPDRCPLPASNSVCANGTVCDIISFISAQSFSCVRLFATPWIAAHQASLSITNSRSSPKLMCIKSVMPSSHLILCRSLLLLPPIRPSIRVFSNESTLHMRWPKYWSFSFSISPSNVYSELISFRMDCLDLLAVQGTLRSLLQHHSLKASILWLSTFFIVQLSDPYMTTGKTIALTFVDKVMSLLFNMLSRLVITFPPRSKHLLITWLQSPSAVILKSHNLVITIEHFVDKGPSSQRYGFPVVMYRCEKWTIKKAEHRRIDAFKLW